MMNGLKGIATLVTAIAVLSMTGSAFAGKDDRGNGRGNGGDKGDQPVAVPEGGSTLLLLGAALVGVAAYRRWASRITNS